MKKVLRTVLTTAALVSLAACGSSSSSATTAAATSAAADDGTKSEGVLTYAEYAAADLDTEVTVETYVQAKQSWWENEGVGTATLYTQDQDGGYFIYNLPIDEDDYDNLTTGTKIKVTGYKSEFSGEIEIQDATYEVEDGSYIAEAVDVTDLLSDEDALAEKMNQFVSFTGMTIEPSTDPDGNEVAFLYNYDGSGTEGDDLYFNVSIDGNTYSFTVESYLCDADSDVYKAVEALSVGDVVDMEGFLYWYNGPNPHITSVTVE